MATALSMNQALTEVKKVTDARERKHRDFHILFIGASGAGKTSLLNLIGQFGFINEHGIERTIVEFKLYNDPKLERHLDDPMASKTSCTRSYDIKIGDIPFKITDTPGLGTDSAGIGKEKENVQNIVEFLKKVDYVDCVCLVINGRTPRGIPEVKYALSEISALLPNVANNNTILCLTNTERLTKVSFKIETLKEFFKHGLQEGNTFCIENPLCELANTRKLNQTGVMDEDIKEEYELAQKEFCRMLLKIKDFHPLPTTTFMEVYMAKQAVEREILAITVHQYNQKQLDPLKAHCAGTVKFTIISISEDKHYNTLCDYPGCYKNCHIQCQLPHSFDAEVFKDCNCMGGSRSVCAVCSHPYTTHYHQFVRFDSKEVQMEYANIFDQINKGISQAVQSLSEKIKKFNELSSAKNYVNVLKTQQHIIQLHLKAYGSTPVLEEAQKRVNAALAIVEKVH